MEFLLSNYVVCSELGLLPNGVAYSDQFSLPNHVVYNESAFVAEITFSTTNLCSLLKLCVYSESTFATEMCVLL